MLTRVVARVSRVTRELLPNVLTRLSLAAVHKQDRLHTVALQIRRAAHQVTVQGAENRENANEASGEAGEADTLA